MPEIVVAPLFGNDPSPTNATAVMTSAQSQATPVIDDVAEQVLEPTQNGIQTVVAHPMATFSVPVNLPKDNDLDALSSSVSSSYGQANAKILAMHKTGDLGAMGDGINQLILTAKGLNPSTQKGGILDHLKSKFYGEKETLLAHTESVQQRLNTISAQLEKNNNQMKQEIQLLEDMKRDNIQDQTRTKDSIDRVRGWLDEVNAALAMPVVDPNDINEVTQRQGIKHMQQRLAPMLNNFQNALVLYQQMAVKLQKDQDDIRTGVAQFEQIKAISIPALIGMVSQQLIAMDQKHQMETEKAIMDMTNDAIRQTAESVGQNAIMAATMQQQSVVSLDDLTQAQDILDKANEEVQKIQQQGEIRRKEEDAKRADLERRLLNPVT